LLPIFLVACLGVSFVAACLGLVLLLYLGLYLPDAWDHARLKTEMVEAGICPPTPSETDRTIPQPAIINTSPDGAWTIGAPWSENEGYDWVLTNNKSGQTYYQGYSKKDSCWSIPTRIRVLWSPDSHYVAIDAITNGNEHVHVMSLLGKEPEYIGFEQGSALIEGASIMLMNREDEQEKFFVQKQRSRALQWINNTDLVAIVYVDESEGENPYEIETADHETYHFDGNSITATAAKRDFYEKFITDL
jgi:hypothetical protein